MKRLFSTLSKRIMFLFVISILAIQIITFWFIESTLSQNNIKNDLTLSQRLATLYRIVDKTEIELQARMALDMSSENIEVLVAAYPFTDLLNQEDLILIKNKILDALSEENIAHIYFGEIKNETNSLGLSLELQSKKWLNIHIHAHHKHQYLIKNIIYYFIAITTLFIVGVTILLRWLAKPLENMARSVSFLKNPSDKLTFQKSDTQEMKLLGTAINQMQSHMLKLIDQRTYALAAISHDLKTPLTRMRMRIEELHEKKLHHAFAQDLSEMEQMVDSTLYYLKSGGNEEQRQVIDIVSILETIKNEANDSGFMASFSSLDHTRIKIYGQHFAIKRALSNIVYNAIKYGKEAIINITLHAEEVRVTVEDTGKGIQPFYFEKVFEPFMRLETSRNSNTGGFGLGLTIAKTIIENHQGRISLSLTALGSLKVDIILPLHAKHA